MPTSDSGDVELYWERAGGGPRLMFCNGSSTTIDELRPLRELLADRFELLSWDYRGLGRSGRAASPYAMADVAGDAVAVLDGAGWDSCRLMGLSFGGMVALEFAVTHPERVERLALACTSAGGESGASYPLEQLAALDPAERTARWLRLLDERWDERWLAEHPLDRALAERAAVDRDRVDPDGAEGRRLQLRARAGHDVSARLAAIDAPTLVGYGRHDRVAPAANSRAIAERVAGAELRGYDGGHLFLAQDPTALGEFQAFLATP